MTGIYFLIKDNIIVYIGQSINVEKRIVSHRDKDFDSFRVIVCDNSKLLEYEKRLISLFKPKLNGSPGGKRDGAGRPKGSKTAEETTVIRVPVRLVPKIKELIFNNNLVVSKQ